MKRGLSFLFAGCAWVGFAGTSCACAQQLPPFGDSPGFGDPSVAGRRPGLSGSLPVYLSGKVVLEDGSAGPAGVRIVRVCGDGSRSFAATTDRKGQFSYQSGATDDVLTGSASEPLAVDRRGVGCELRAEAAGYRADPVRIDSAGRSGRDAIAIVLHRQEGAEVVAVASSPTTAKAPGDARKAYDRGLEAMRKGKSADAEKDFEKAVNAYPQFAEAWLNLGKLGLQDKKPEVAQEAFEKAVAADDNLAEAHLQLGMLAAGQRRWADAAKEMDATLRLDAKGFPQAWFADAVANFNGKNFDAAETSAREALKLDGNHANPEIDRLLGLILASKKDYAGAVAELKVYLSLAPGSADAGQVKSQIADIEKMQASARP